MNSNFNIYLASTYHSESQKIRVMSEHWVGDNIFCPKCGHSINQYKNNTPIDDFFCPRCNNDFELKSKYQSIGNKIVDGAYSQMIKKISARNNPDFFFLTYDNEYKVNNFLVIPKHFFVDKIIEERKPLTETARRAGWVGCNILLNNIPEIGRIFYVKNYEVFKQKDIIDKYNQTVFLEKTTTQTKGWLLDIMACIDSLKKDKFTLDEIYKFADILQNKHPNNNHIKDKIRQQLQFLRDKGYLAFSGNGAYALSRPS